MSKLTARQKHYYHLIHPTPTSENSWLPEEELQSQWQELASLYTHRTLTFPTDRLPAISVLAAHFGSGLKDEYKAGLWKSQLTKEFLWKLDGPKLLKEAPASYQAPSWSWATVNQHIKFCPTQVIDEYFEVVDSETWPSNANTTLISHDSSFGAVDCGTLVVKGRLRRATCRTLPHCTKNTCQEKTLYRDAEVLSTNVLTAIPYPDALFPTARKILCWQFF